MEEHIGLKAGQWMTQGERKKDQAEEDEMSDREGEREKGRLAWNRAWTLMYCQADIVNALVPGICRVRVCSYPPCDSVIDITFLSVSLVGVRLCVHRNTHTSSWEPCTEMNGHAVSVPHTTRPRYTPRADRRYTERENEVRHER